MPENAYFPNILPSLWTGAAVHLHPGWWPCRIRCSCQIAKITALLFSRPLLFIEKRHARSGQKSLFYNFLNWYQIHQKWFEIKDLMKWRRHSLPPRIFPELDTCKPYLIAYIRNSTLRNKKNIARRSMLDLDLLVGRKLARSVHCPDIEL